MKEADIQFLDEKGRENEFDHESGQDRTATTGPQK